MNTFIKLKYSYDTRKKRIYIIYDIIYIRNELKLYIRNDIYILVHVYFSSDVG